MYAYPDARWVGLKLRFAFIAPDAARTASYSSSAQDRTSQIGQTIDDVEDISLKHAGLEWNRWGLNQDFKVLPDNLSGLETGWACDAISDENGIFADQPYLEFTFPQPQTSVGFTLTFDATANEYPSQFTVTTYSQGGALLGQKQMTCKKPSIVVPLHSTDYSRVVITFERTPLPYHRVRVCEVLFGVIEIFDRDSIAEATLLYEMSPAAESLPTRRMDVKIDNSDRRFNIINPDGIYSFLQQPQGFSVSMGVGDRKDNIEYTNMGEFFFASASAEDGGLTAQLSAYDWFYWLENGTYVNAESGTWTLQQALTDIIQTSGISCEIEIAPGIGNKLVRKTMDGVSLREAIRLVVQACCATAYFDRRGVLVVKDISEGVVVDTLTNERLNSPPKVSTDKTVNTVQLTITADNGEDAVYTAFNAHEGELPQVKEVTNRQVVPQNAQAVANWLLASVSGQLTYTTKERGNPETALTETVKIYDFYDVNRNAIIIKQTFTYNGGLSAESVAVTR